MRRNTGQIKDVGNGKIQVTIFTGRDANGKRHYHKKTFLGTKKDGVRYIRKVLTELENGTFSEPCVLSLNDYLDKWLEAAAKPRLSNRTFYDYQSRLKCYIRKPLGQIRLKTLQPLDVQKVYSEMQERNLSARIVRYTHTILSSALKQAVKWGMIARNPCEFVQLPKEQPKTRRVLSPDEAARFLSTIKGEKHGVLFTLALTTGMRPEEYLVLQWKQYLRQIKQKSLKNYNDEYCLFEK